MGMIGKSECPLRVYPGQQNGTTQAAPPAETAAKVEAVSKSRADRSRSRTPDWKETFRKKTVDDMIKEQVEAQAKAAEKDKKEKERRVAEQRRLELMAQEKKKIEEAFEKRKKEAEARKLAEEEEWRRGLREQREQEAAEEALELAQ